LERVTPGPGKDVSLSAVASQIGAPSASSPSYASGRLLAFASNAYNLVPSDANEAGDAFVVESLPEAPVRPSEIGPPPPPRGEQPAWRLTATATSRPNGTVRLLAVVPGKGTLRARVTAQLGERLISRRVAAARRRARGAGVLRADLRLPRGLRRFARAKGGLVATVNLSFSGPGGGPLREQLETRFRHRGGAGGRGQ
jgi:hypothetical protein